MKVAVRSLLAIDFEGVDSRKVSPTVHEHHTNEPCSYVGRLVQNSFITQLVSGDRTALTSCESIWSECCVSGRSANRTTAFNYSRTRAAVVQTFLVDPLERCRGMLVAGLHQNALDCGTHISISTRS